METLPSQGELVLVKMWRMVQMCISPDEFLHRKQTKVERCVYKHTHIHTHTMQPYYSRIINLTITRFWNKIHGRTQIYYSSGDELCRSWSWFGSWSESWSRSKSWSGRQIGSTPVFCHLTGAQCSEAIAIVTQHCSIGGA